MPQGLRVALFTGNYNYLKEGANQALNRLVAHLETRVDADVRIYSPVTDTPAFEPEGTLVPVRSIALPGRAEFRLGLGLSRAHRDEILHFDPHLIHVATPDILGTRAQSFALRHRIPLVASLHTLFETYPEYYGLGFLRPLVEWHLDRFYGRSDLVLVPTPSLAGEMARKHGRERMGVWARGVERELFAPARRSEDWRERHDLAHGEVALLFLGRLVLEKRTDQFAEIVANLKAKGFAVRPVIVGAGPARERMERALPDGVFTGHLTGDALATAVASCDIFINPSATETFGNVTLEAMSAGLAVVAADVPSTHNLITHGETGLVAAPDTAGFAVQAELLLADPSLQARLGQAARKAALARSWDAVLDAVLEQYAALLASRC
ncbi:MAG: glycosyltransferase family 1 protein [Sphingomonadaceae bacterium]